MRHSRASVSTLIGLIVALATMGSMSVQPRVHQTAGRRNAMFRVTRGAPRLDAADAISHDGHHHDPLEAPQADGSSLTRALTPPGVTAGPDTQSGHGSLPALVPQSAVVYDPQSDPDALIADVSTPILARSDSPSRGRAPPAL